MKLPVNLLKHNKIHLAIFLLLIVYLLSADMIFNSLITVKDESPQFNFEIPHEKTRLLIGVDAVEIINIEWKKVINIHGWAFKPGENVSTTKKYVVLLSENATYIFGTSSFDRPDIAKKFSPKTTDYFESGFYTNIPIYNIRNGRYQIGIILKNETVSSFAISGTGITKNDTMVIPGILSERYGPIPIKKMSSIKYHFDETREKKIGDIKVLAVTGWAFIPNDISPETKKYVVLISKNETYIFDTLPVHRPDVARFFNDQTINVEESGFHANIPLYSIGNGTYKLGIIVQENGDNFLNISTDTITISNT